MKLNTALLLLFLMPLSLLGQKKELTLRDIMQIPSIQQAIISDNGQWLVYSVARDRGDGFGIIKEIGGRKEYRIERAASPSVSTQGEWVAFTVLPPAIDIENAGKPADRPKNDMTLVQTSSGQTRDFENVQSFNFSNNGAWLAVHHHNKEIPDSLKKASAGWRKNIGSNLTVLNLESGDTLLIPFVTAAQFDSLSTVLVYTVADTSGDLNGVFFRYLHDITAENTVVQRPKSQSGAFAWHAQTRRMAFLTAEEDNKENVRVSDLVLYDFSNERNVLLIADSAISRTHYLPFRNTISFTDDGKRLFFGIKPISELPPTEPEKEKWDEENFYDYDKILNSKEVDVWHWNDPLIKTHEKQTWNQRSNRSYLTVFHLDLNTWVQLADADVPSASVAQNERIVLATSNLPYQKEITWDGDYSDIYTIDLKTGEKTKIVTKQRFGAQLSPDGSVIVFYNDGHWHVYHISSGTFRNLTLETGAPFYNEDDDRPAPPNGYGIAGWIHDEPAVLIYDKFDIWMFRTDRQEAKNLTAKGREDHRVYRILRTERDQKFTLKGKILLSSYNDIQKNYGFYSLDLDTNRLTRLLEEPKRFRFMAKAESANRLLFSREAYDEYPDLWIADDSFRRPQRQTNLFPELKEYAWGNAERVEWLSMDGTPVQGVLIKPGNYKPGQQYPVIVYFYELFSQRLYDWNQQVVNHRPSFPFYASHGYAIFLPDVRYTLGQPGYSATKYIVPGVQKLIEMGIANPNSIGLHGHSWSGYQAAHMVTQTDIFSAVVTGAPVSNMTSAYSGIRWGSGLARMFQYEQAQSRLGASMWERRDLYIENSPVFFADRINTPMLIMHGDDDDAVPWYQAIELYLALRRLEKDVIFLQYRGEPHHLRKYGNKLDYAIRMKEYFDHYLKGEPAAEWIQSGIPYSGN